MSKIHITLVGGQPAPVYNAIIATSPDKIIYIYSASDGSRKSLEALTKEIDIEHDKILLDTTNPLKIKNCARQLASKYAQDEVTVNISGGLKSWSHWFGVIFDKCDNASVVYIDQNNLLWNYRTMQSCSNFNFDMHTLFRLYGNPIEGNYTPFSDFVKADFDAIPQIKRCRRVNPVAFNALVTVLSKENSHNLRNNDVGLITHGDSSVTWNKTLSQVSLFLTNRRGDYTASYTINCPHAIDLVFNAGWFELEIAQLLSKWSKAKEICLNCRFPYNKNLDKNEVDIIVNTGNKILFVECKTQISNNTDIDKFRSVIKTYGGLGSKGLFITDAKMNQINIAKCQEHGIIPFSLSDEHLTIDARSALYMFLDSQLYDINTN